MAKYKLPESFFTEAQTAQTEFNKKTFDQWKEGAAQYDSAYSDLDKFIFPFIGETDEARKIFILLVEAYFNREKGGFALYTSNGFPVIFSSSQKSPSWQKSLPLVNPKKPPTLRVINKENIFSQFTLVNDIFSQGGSSISSKESFNDLGKDMIRLLTEAPGMIPYIIKLMTNTYPKAYNTMAVDKQQPLSNEALTEDFNSLYNQMLGKLQDLVDGDS